MASPAWLAKVISESTFSSSDIEGSLRIVNQENTADFDIIPVHISTSKTRYHEGFDFFQNFNRIGHKLATAEP